MTLKELRKGISDPYLLKHFFTHQYKLSKSLIKQGEILPLAGIYTDVVVGTNVPKHFDLVNEDKVIKSEINGYEMILPYSDEGISRTLLKYGVKESDSSKSLYNLISKITDNKREFNILELGANIGYFALLENSASQCNTHTYAIEPHPDNIKILKENVRINDLYESFTIARAAAGSSNKEGYLTVNSSQSNLHKIDNNVEESDAERIPVQIIRGDSFIQKLDILPSEIDLVRFDVEGYENDILKGIDGILQSDSNLVLFFELHDFIGDGEQEEILNKLKDYGFEFYSAAPQDINSFQDVLDSSAHVELICMRNN